MLTFFYQFVFLRLRIIFQISCSHSWYHSTMKLILSLAQTFVHDVAVSPRLSSDRFLSFKCFMIIFFPVPYNFGTKLQPESAWTSISYGSISAFFLSVLLVSIRDRLVSKASISTFDLQPCQNTYTINKTNTSVP